MLIGFVVLYLVLSIGIGLYAATKVHSASDYITAGRSLPMIVVIAMVFATWFGAETVLGISATFLDENLGGTISDPFGASLALILFGLFFARPLYRMKLLTLGDFYRQRYNRPVEVVISAAIALSYLGWVSAQVVALGLVFNVLVGRPHHPGGRHAHRRGGGAALHPVRRHVVGGAYHPRADDRHRRRPAVDRQAGRRYARGQRHRAGGRTRRRSRQIRILAAAGMGGSGHLHRRPAHHGARLDSSAGRVPARQHQSRPSASQYGARSSVVHYIFSSPRCRFISPTPPPWSTRP